MVRIVSFMLFLFINQSLFAYGNEEFRATWVITWEHISPYDTPEENMARVQAIMDDHVTANMNAVLWQARQSGTAYYNSSFEPWGYYAGYQDPGYDPLAYAIEQAHGRGLELHAWFNVFATSSTYPGTPAEEHPEWICRDRDGIPMTDNRALSPGLESVRTYLLDVAMEIVNNYDIDGIHLDYIRWNEYTNSPQSKDFAREVRKNRYLDGMITQKQIDELNQNPSGRYLYDIDHPYSAGIPDSANGGQFPSWEEWWRWSVTEFVRVLHDSIQAVKPWVRLSTASLGRYNWGSWQAYGTVYQDAALWFNEGNIEQLTPMNYHWTTAQGFYGMLTGACPQCWSQFIQPGIEAGRLYSVGPGSYRFHETNVWDNHPDVIEICRTIPWVDGFQFFSFGTWDFYQYWEEASNLFFTSNVKIRSTGLVDSTAPNPVELSMIPVDSLTYQLIVTPSEMDTSAHWFAIYRSENDTMNPQTDEIRDIHFGDSTYVYIDQFSGNQDFNGQYHYYGTALDRFWNESYLSGVAVTDSVPSFPPVVVMSDPVEGDTVPVNSSIQIFFSKTMDINSVNGAFSISPAMEISQKLWSYDHKTVTLTFDQGFLYATEYFLTIDSTATDINGTLIDGNNDGVEGDGYELYFITESEDVQGPVIVYSHPNVMAYTEDLDIWDVIRFIFNEVVDGETVNDSTVIIQQGENIIPVDRLLTAAMGKSVLTIRPAEGFEVATEYSIDLTAGITDLLGNPMVTDISTLFSTSENGYVVISMIDEFNSVNNWWQPNQSGSTTGILAGTSFGTSSQIYLPATSPHKSAKLSYVWDTSAPEHLLREYLSGGPPRDVWFDTSYVLQCYVWGDGSNNRFRFCVDDHVPDAAAEYHEVSPWFLLDWTGWRLIEWDLGSGVVGTWIGNGILEGNLRIDSFQMTYQPGSAPSGTIYFDHLRAVRKSPMVTVAESPPLLPMQVTLHQNFPNPFNTVTVIPFDLPSDMYVNLVIYDLLGRRVKTLVDGLISEGYKTVVWQGDTELGIPAASGIYIYRLMLENNTYLSNRMLLLK